MIISFLCCFILFCMLLLLSYTTTHFIQKYKFYKMKLKIIQTQINLFFFVSFRLNQQKIDFDSTIDYILAFIFDNETKYIYFIKDFFQVKMNDINLTQSYFVNKSRLYNKNLQISQNHDKIEDIFLLNANRSYLAQMSGVIKSEINPQKSNQSLNISRKNKRIDFEQFSGVQTSNIYHFESLKGDWQLLEILALKQQGQKDYKQVPQSLLFCCEGNIIPLICKAKLLDCHFQLIKTNVNKPLSKQQLFYSINFDTIKSNVYYQQLHGNSQLIITTEKVTLIMKALQKNGGRFWFKELQNSISKSKGKHYSLTFLDSINKFYKKRFETENFFSNHCKNGDILLFQDNHFMAKMQRFLTRSDYDHVGIVIKDKKHGLLIFQSNSGSGVCLTPWKFLILFEWYKAIPRITWRRLQLERPNDFDMKLEEFVVNNLPRQFHLSIAKLTAQQSFIVVDQPSTAEVILNKNQTNGFFCSELIAKTYKHLGLLTSDNTSPYYLPSSRFYPRDFSEFVQLQLEQGYLSEQRQIVFERQLLIEDYPNID